MRITPADAGKTQCRLFCTKRYQDHPRRCGENTRLTAATLSLKGSPPQVRGKRMLIISHREELGITPAGAGKTELAANPANMRQDHPRRCGENGISVPSVKTITESPPQVRGKLDSL